MITFRFTILIGLSIMLFFISTLSFYDLTYDAYSENQMLVNSSSNTNTKNIDNIQAPNFNFEQKLNKILSGGMNVLITDTINKLKPTSLNNSVNITSVSNYANISSISSSNNVNSSTKIPFISSDDKSTIASLNADLANKKDTSPSSLPKSSVDLANKKDTSPSSLPKSSVDLANKKDTSPSSLPKSSVDLANKKDTSPSSLPKSSVDLANKKDTNILSTFNFDDLALFPTTKIINDIYSELGKGSNQNLLNTTKS